jgi:hypothetical protein
VCIRIAVIQPEQEAVHFIVKKFGALIGPAWRPMKNVYEVLREKEMLLARVRAEVDALRVVVPLLTDQHGEAGDDRVMNQPDLLWVPALQRNKWPLKVSNPAPSYSES